MTEKYQTQKISESNIKKAKSKGMSTNQYIDHLESLVEQGRTQVIDALISQVQTLSGTVESLAEALKHQRFITDAIALNNETQSKMIGTLIEMQKVNNENQTNLMNAFGADIEFIQALKKEITE